MSHAQAKLHARATEAEAAWRKTLVRKERDKLKTQASLWGRHGGNLVAPKPRHGKTFHKREKLRRKREALLRAASCLRRGEARLSGTYGRLNRKGGPSFRLTAPNYHIARPPTGPIAGNMIGMEKAERAPAKRDGPRMVAAQAWATLRIAAHR